MQLAVQFESPLQPIPKRGEQMNGLLFILMHACMLMLLWVLQKSALTATVLICAGPVADSSNMVASVRKAGENRAVIELEKRGQTKYVAEGDLLQRSYMVSQNGQQVAQVLLIVSDRCHLSFMQAARTVGKG